MRLPIFLISCSLFNLDVIIPKLKDRINRVIIDIKKWKRTALYNFKPTPINKILNWADEIYKINFFKLYDLISKIEKMKVKKEPNIIKIFK